MGVQARISPGKHTETSKTVVLGGQTPVQTWSRARQRWPCATDFACMEDLDLRGSWSLMSGSREMLKADSEKRNRSSCKESLGVIWDIQFGIYSKCQDVMSDKEHKLWTRVGPREKLCMLLWGTVSPQPGSQTDSSSFKLFLSCSRSQQPVLNRQTYKEDDSQFLWFQMTSWAPNARCRASGCSACCDRF